MKKKILAIFATALLLALCAIPCFAYPSQNLTFGGFYQNEDVTPYVTREFRGDIQAEISTPVFWESDLSREISGFILEVEIPFLSGYGGDCRLYFEQWFSASYSATDVVQTRGYAEGSSTFYFVAPRRNIEIIQLAIFLTEYYTFTPEDDPIVCTLYPISLNTAEIEEASYNSGYQGGYNDGRVQGQGDAEDLDGFLVDIFGALAEFFTPLAEFEIWGISVMGILSLVVVGTIAVIIFKMKG